MSDIVPINPVSSMGKALIDGVGTAKKPSTPAEIKQEFVGMLLDQVFLKSFMKDEEEGVFAKEEDDLFGGDAASGMYKDIARSEMIKQLSTDERFGLEKLLDNAPSLAI